MSSGLLVDLHLTHTVRRSQDKSFCRQFGFGLCDGDSQVLKALQGRSHRCFRSSDTANWFYLIVFNFAGGM